MNRGFYFPLSFVFACVGVHTCLCAQVCACEGQRSTPMLLYTFFFLRQHSSVNLELTNWLDWLVREPHEPHLYTSALELQTLIIMPVFLHWLKMDTWAFMLCHLPSPEHCHFLEIWASGSGQAVKERALQSWQPEFDPWSRRGKERASSWKLSSDLRTHVLAPLCTPVQ